MKRARLTTSILFVLSVPALASLPSQAKTWQVSGSIVDEQGAPMPEAELARYFMYMGGRYTTGVDVLKSDAQGRFAGIIKPYKLRLVYIALNKERTVGAAGVLTEKSVNQPLKIVLKPFGKVSFRPKIES